MRTRAERHNSLSSEFRWRMRLNHSVWVPLVVVATPAIILRTAHLTSLGYNSDEAVYAGQGLALAKEEAYLPYFPAFRAHPLLFQATLAVIFKVFGFSEVAGRMASVVFGLAMVAAAFGLGKVLYGPRVGWVAAAIVGVMPYTVVVNRQVLLDGPTALLATVAITLVAKYVLTHRATWLYAASTFFGLAILAKETSVLLLGGIYAFFALAPVVRIRWRQISVALALLAATTLVYPVSVALSGQARTGNNFVVWQLLRRSNHPWSFYLQVVPPALGWAAVAAALGGLWFLRRQGTWRESLLVYTVLGPVLFYGVWPVKGFQYLLPIAGPVAVLAARGLLSLGDRREWFLGRLTLQGRLLSALAVLVTVTTLGVQSWRVITPSSVGTSFLAGSGGVPGGREAGTWVGAHVPVGAEVLCLGPSMANIISFYGHRKAYGLSVSPNPLHRNPVYESILNPDLAIRHNDLQYIVWDSFSADRSPFFSARLLDYAKRYHGHVVHSESITVETSSGPAVKPVIVIYQVRP